MKHNPCENLPAWRIQIAAEQLTGLPVGMPEEHLALDAATWLDIFLERDAAGIREAEEPEPVIDRDVLIIEYLRAHPDSTQRECWRELQAGFEIGNHHLGQFFTKLERKGVIERSGSQANHMAKDGEVPTWSVAEEVTV